MNVSEETRNTLQYICDGLLPYLDESQRRIFLGLSAEALGHGGIAVMREISGASRNTISIGISEFHKDQAENTSWGTDPGHRGGGGRKTSREKIPGLYEKIDTIVTGGKYGRSSKILLWSTMGIRKISDTLNERYNMGACTKVIVKALDSLGYSRQNMKPNPLAGEERPDRNEQFKLISDTAEDFIEQGDPVIWADTRKLELAGDFLSGKVIFRRKDNPPSVIDRDLALPDPGDPAPGGLYVSGNTGFLDFGTDPGAEETAIESVHRWWDCVGKATFPDAKKIYITVDRGCSPARIWKYGLQELADRAGLEIHVSHFPSGTFKWNYTKHRLICYTAGSRQGRPVIDIECAVSLVASDAPASDLKVSCASDGYRFERRREISDEDMASINLERREPYGNWNYIIRPRAPFS